MMKKRILVICFCLCAALAHAQTPTEYTFREGLAADSLHRYGREALVTDALTHAWFTGQFTTPSTTGKIIQWTPIKADSAGLFKGRAIVNGYLYLTYDAPAEQTALLHVSGHNMLFFNGEPHAGDIYRLGWLYVPVKIKKGKNELLIRCSSWAVRQGVSARLLFQEKSVVLRTDDATLPHVVIGQSTENLWGAVVAVNASDKTLTDLHITAKLEGKEVTTPLPALTPWSIRKVGFRIDPTGVAAKGSYTCTLIIRQGASGRALDTQEIKIDAMQPQDHYSKTFVSDIDGSIQYYSVTPQLGGSTTAPALFFSVHGASVEAISQARAYRSKDWGVLVAPTNRRPRGFNWEDWGRLDALEVLAQAKQQFTPDPKRIYLTGHSMGGHGTWYLGATYPGNWAAIAPCAGYPTLTGYGSADGKIPTESRSATEKMLLRASNPSDVIALASNYKGLGIYIHHGDSDKVVSVDYARQMRRLLGDFHKDFSYYEYPGGSHWFGNESVDWNPIFEYFKWHTIQPDSAVDKLEFTTANPAISHHYRWVSIAQQQHVLDYSKVDLARDKKKKTITGTTTNVSIAGLSLAVFNTGDVITLTLDGQPTISYTKTSAEWVYLTRSGNAWQVSAKPDAKQKGVTRNGTFKEPFKNRMVFVYSTKGTAAENAWSYTKARYDAEVWYYRGNGAVDIVADQAFQPAKYPDRGVILYGNATTNAAWNKLLKNCPITLTRNLVTIDGQQYRGDQYGAYFMWPRADSDVASVAVIGGTGLPGMSATEPNQYFAGGSGFPDYTILSTEMLKHGADGVLSTGYYSNDWRIETGERTTRTNTNTGTLKK
jgi:dienelactone hydrolase